MITKDQLHTDQYSLYNSDCMEILPSLPDESVDLSVYSPPFAGLYNYSSSERDFSNCETKEQFIEQYDFLIEQISRVTKKGRISAVHCTDVFDNTSRLWDFPHEIIKLHEKHGFEYRCRIGIRKEPLKVRMRTMVQSLMHKFIVEDTTRCFPSMPDYVLIFTKKGENQVPVTHTLGMIEYPYFGEEPILRHMVETFNEQNGTKFTADEYWQYILDKFKGHTDAKTNTHAHIVWRRYADYMWDDIRIDNVLPFKDTKDPDDEKHVHPLQLDVIDRLVYMYSNPNEVVLTPFMGVGSEVYSSVSMCRRAIGIELKDSYYKQAILNINEASKRFSTVQQVELF